MELLAYVLLFALLIAGEALKNPAERWKDPDEKIRNQVSKFFFGKNSNLGVENERHYDKTEQSIPKHTKGSAQRQR